MKILNIKIKGMTSIYCIRDIKESLKNIKNIKNININLDSGKANIYYNNKVNYKKIVKKIKKLGYEVIESDLDKIKYRKEHKQNYILSLIIFIIIIIIEHIFNNKIGYVSCFVLSTFLIYLSFKHLKEGFLNLIKLKLDVSTLYTVTIMLIYGYSNYNLISYLFFSQDNRYIFYDTMAFLICLHLTSKYMHYHKIKKTVSNLDELSNYLPKNATVIEDNNNVIKEIDELTKDDLVLIKKNERIPCDGMILKGKTNIDESILLKREKVFKKEGNVVYAGTLNLDEDIIIKPINTNSISNIIDNIYYSYSEDYFKENTIIKYLKKYTLYIFIISIITFSIWIIIKHYQEGLNKLFITLMQIYPVSFSLASILAISIGTHYSNKYKIYFVTDKSIETLTKLDYLLFYDIDLFCDDVKLIDVYYDENFSRDKILKYIISMIQDFNPFFKKEIMKYYKKNIYRINNVKLIDDYYLGYYKNQEIIVGSAETMKKLNINISNFDININGFKIYLAINKKVMGFVLIQEIISSKSKKFLKQLRKLKIEPILLSKYQKSEIVDVLNELNINNYHFNLSDNNIKDIINIYKRKGIVGFCTKTTHLYTNSDIDINISKKYSKFIFSNILIYNDDIMGIIYSVIISNNIILKTKQNILISFILNILLIFFSTGFLQLFGIKYNSNTIFIVVFIINLMIYINSLFIKIRIKRKIDKILID